MYQIQQQLTKLRAQGMNETSPHVLQCKKYLQVSGGVSLLS